MTRRTRGAILCVRHGETKRVVPDYRAKVSWAEGVAKSIVWLDVDPARQTVDDALHARLDRLITLQGAHSPDDSWRGCSD